MAAAAHFLYLIPPNAIEQRWIRLFKLFLSSKWKKNGTNPKWEYPHQWKFPWVNPCLRALPVAVGLGEEEEVEVTGQVEVMGEVEVTGELEVTEEGNTIVVAMEAAMEVEVVAGMEAEVEVVIGKMNQFWDLSLAGQKISEQF